MRLPRPALIALLAALALAGCETAEERAQAHFERALTLIAEGDTTRAALEFRNVFRLDGEHAEARAAYAAMLRETGDTKAAFAQYLRLIEQRPDDLAARTALAEMALEIGDFAAAGEHVTRAFALAPADAQVRALKATVDYREGDRDAALAMAAEVVEAAPETVAAQMVLIAERMNADDTPGALAQIDAALTHAPRDRGLHIVRLAALEAAGDEAGSGAQLRRMAELFPEEPEVRQALVQWHLRAGDPDAAEAVLRAEAESRPEDPEAALEVVQFLLEIRGEEAARAELDRLIAAAPETPDFRQALAGLDFAAGRTEAAIEGLRALVEGAEPSDAVRDLQVSLAGMLDATGDTAGRDALIASVLEADPAHVVALKLRARSEITADRPERAIADLRTALAQAPQDPEIMTIMAAAHEREGARELAGEQYARAVEASARAPAESLRYAGFLMREGRPGPAEGVLADALARAPGDPDLLAALGRLHLERRDWPRLRQVAARLRETGEAPAAAMAAELEMAALAAQGETEAALADLARGAGDGDASAMARLVQAQAQAGDLDAAQTALDTLLAADPEGLEGRILQAGLQTLRGETERAEAAWRALTAEAPALPGPHQALATLLAGTGRAKEALTALDAGIEATGGEAELMFAKAGLLEARGDIDGAIATYETLYARDSGSPVVANNLASLIATHRAAGEGPEAEAARERAYVIARRLRGSDVPQFQDTYGWIAHLRGDRAAALAALEPAARALPGNALVQFHLAEAQAAAGETLAARASFAAAREAAEAGGEAELAATAGARLTELDAGDGTAAAPLR